MSVDVAEVHPKRTLYMTVVNYRGPVKKVSFVAVEGKQACLSFLPPHGFLGPGERARVQLGMESVDESTIAVVYGFDLAGNNVYAWSANGQGAIGRRARDGGDGGRRTYPKHRSSRASTRLPRTRRRLSNERPCCYPTRTSGHDPRCR